MAVLLTTYYVLLTTYYLLLTTYYVLLATYYLLLTTYCKVGIRTCLVTTGCHNLACQQSYQKDPAHFHAPSVASLIADGGVTASNMAQPSGWSSGRGGAVVGANSNPPLLGREYQGNEGLREWMLGQGNVLRPRSDNDELWESLQPALLSHFEAWEDKYGNGQIGACGLSQAVQQLGLSMLTLSEFAARLEPPALRHKLQSMLSPPTILAAADGGPTGGGSAGCSTSVAEGRVAATFPRPSEDCSAAPSLNADEFCEVLGGALVAAGVLAQKRSRKQGVVVSFLGHIVRKSRDEELGRQDARRRRPMARWQLCRRARALGRAAEVRSSAVGSSKPLVVSG